MALVFQKDPSFFAGYQDVPMKLEVKSGRPWWALPPQREKFHENSCCVLETRDTRAMDTP